MVICLRVILLKESLLSVLFIYGSIAGQIVLVKQIPLPIRNYFGFNTMQEYDLGVSLCVKGLYTFPLWFFLQRIVGRLISYLGGLKPRRLAHIFIIQCRFTGVFLLWVQKGLIVINFTPQRTTILATVAIPQMEEFKFLEPRGQAAAGAYSDR